MSVNINCVCSFCLGTFVTKVTATDADDPVYGNSAKLVYSILEGQPYFSIEPHTGRWLWTATPGLANHLILLQGRLRLGVGKNFFMERSVQPWHTCPEQCGESPSLLGFKALWVWHLGPWTRWAWQGWGMVGNDLRGFFQAGVILWFYLQRWPPLPPVYLITQV